MTNLHELREKAHEAALKAYLEVPAGTIDVGHIADAVLLVVTQSLKDALQCKHGMPHYCPNCDRSWNDIHADLLVVTQYVEQHEKEKNDSCAGLIHQIASPIEGTEPRLSTEAANLMREHAKRAIASELPEDEPDTIPDWCYDTIIHATLMRTRRALAAAPPIPDVAERVPASGSVSARLIDVDDPMNFGNNKGGG